MNKITALRKKVDKNIKVVDGFMSIMEKARDDASTAYAQAEAEIEQAKEVHNKLIVDYDELKQRCNKVWKFVDKIFGD